MRESQRVGLLFRYPWSMPPSKRSLCALRRTAAVLSLVLSLLALVAASAQASGSPSITIAANDPASVLYGTPATNSLTATNPAGQPYGYNLTFRDVLPVGISYVSGSTSFAGSSVEPEILANEPSTGETTLIWPNLSDLSPSSSATLTYQVSHSTADYNVGSTYTDTPSAYISSNPRYIAQFNSNGTPNGPSSTSYTGYASTSTTTDITAVEIQQLAPGKILRGVHDHQQLYTLQVTNNSVNPTDSPVVVAYLPADLEFLGCGQEENTTNAPTNPGSTEEWPGSGPLTGHTSTPASCLTPTSVSTIEGSPEGQPQGVYTKIEWANLAALTPAEVKDITFVAAVPIRQNTMTWSSGTAPSATSLKQGSNLDNNSGTETYHNEPVDTVATVAGQYNGTLPVSASNTHDAVAKDIIISKSVDKGTINIGDIDHFTLTVSTSEYRYFNNISINDTVPNGLCPVDAEELALSASCAPSSSADVPTEPYTFYSENANGTWSLTWSDTTFPALTQMLPNSSVSVTYPVRVDAYYQANDANTTPVLAADSWTNSTEVAGAESVRCTTSPNCTTSSTEIAHEEANGVIDTDSSSASQSAPSPTIEKTVRVADSTKPVNCQTGTYVTGTATGYGPGDRICFELTVRFPSGVYTGSPQVTDFLPLGTSYEEGSYHATSSSTVHVNSFSSSTPGVLTWGLGASSNSDAEPGQVFQAIISVQANVPDQYPNADVVGNLMKFSYVNTAGQSFPLRALANFTWSAAELTLTEGVDRINGAPSAGHPANTDNFQAESGSAVQIRVDTTNSGGREAENTEIWEDVPSQINCSEVTGISDGGECKVINGANHIVWKGIDIPVGATNTQTYTYTIPPGQQPTTVYDSHAGVVSYQTPDNASGEFTYIPVENINTHVATEVGEPNARKADDPTDVYTGTPTLTVERNTGITASGNTNAQATIGEEVCYVVKLGLPTGVTLNGVPNPVLTDNVGYAANGSRQTFIPGSLAVTYSGGVVPSGVTSEVTAAGVVTLNLPNGYVTGPTPQTYTLNFCGYVTDVAANSRATTEKSTLEDKAAFAYAPDGQSTPTTISGSVTTTIVEPDISLAKTSNASAAVDPGSTVEYTLTETNVNTTRVSVAYNNKVVDTLPAQETPLNSEGHPAVNGGAVAPSGGIWNEGERTITFTGTNLNPGATNVFHYDVSIVQPQVAKSTIKNTALATTTSVPTPAPETEKNPPIQRTAATAELEGISGYKAPAEDTITVADATIAKEVTPASGTIGTVETYTVRVTVPGGIYMYDGTVEDTLPNGMTYNSLQSATCEGGCNLTASEIPPTVNSNGTTTLGFYMGNVTSEPFGVNRVLKLVYTAHINSTYHSGSEVKTGETLTNSAVFYDNPTDTFNNVKPSSPPSPSSYAHASTPATATVHVGEPSITVTKLVNGVSSTSTQPNGVLTYTLAVKNTGSSTAYNVAVHDQPANSIVDVATASGASTTDITEAWGGQGGQMEWAVPSIAAGETVTLTYTAKLAPSGELTNGQEASNTATVPKYFGIPAAERAEHPSFTYREYTHTPSSTAKVTVKLPELGVEITTGLPGYPKSGNAEVNVAFPWRATVSNSSTVATAYNVNLPVTLPPNWTFVPGSVVGAGEPTITTGSGGEQILTWPHLTNLAPGASDSIIFDALPGLAAETNPGSGPSHPNIASDSDTAEDASGATGDHAGPYAAGPKHAEAFLQIPVLVLTKTPKDGLVKSGEDATWTVTVENTGTAPAHSMIVTDKLPAYVVYAPGSATSPTPFTESVNTSGPTDVITWDVTSLAVGAKFVVSIPVHVPSGVESGTELVNNANAVSNEQPTPTEDHGKYTTENDADLQIVKTANVPSVYAGGSLTYSLAIKNNGPSDAKSPTVSDTLPTGETFGAVLSGSGCSAAGNVLTCHPGTMVAGSEQEVRFTVSVSPYYLGPITNTATVSSETPDANPSNNTSSVTTEVLASADLSLAKSVTPELTAVGDDATYTLVAKNNGVSGAKNATISDPLPSGEEFVSASPGCTFAAGTVTCALGNMPDDDSINVTITVKATAVGTIVNTAHVSSETPDPNPSNNTASATLTVVPPTTFSIKKVAKHTKLTAGGTDWFTITAKNTGANIGYNVKVCDMPEPQWTVISAPGATGTPACWTVPTWPVGEARTFKIEMYLSITATGTVKNTASLTALNAPPVSATAHVHVLKESGSSHGDEVETQDVENFVALYPGQTSTVTLSCPSGYQMTDAYPRIDSVDPGSGGTLASIEVLASHSTSLGSYEFVLRDPTGPDGPGDWTDQTAQAHVYGICIGEGTVNGGHKITVGSLHTVTEEWAPGDHVADIACGANEVPVDPGFVISSGYATLNHSESDDSGGWQLGMSVQTPASVTLSIRCMKIWDSKVNGEHEQLVLSDKSATFTVAPGETAEPHIICSGESNGIVGSEELSDGLLLVGSDPQQKTRVFKLYNPTSAPQTANLDLVCVGNRTSRDIKPGHHHH